MLRWLFKKKLHVEEQRPGESMDYLRHIVDVSPLAFLRFVSILPLANCRRVLPKEPWYVAQLVTLQHEDCGTCLQIGINLAKKDGVSTHVIRATVCGDIEAIPEEMQIVYRFTKSILNVTDEADSLREILRQRYGEQGLIELAYAIAGAKIPPTVKRTLGYAQNCQVVPPKIE